MVGKKLTKRVRRRRLTPADFAEVGLPPRLMVLLLPATKRALYGTAAALQKRKLDPAQKKVYMEALQKLAEAAAMP